MLSGGMRMQETWNPKPDMTLELINAECQKNFKNIVQRSMEVHTYINMNINMNINTFLHIFLFS